METGVKTLLVCGSGRTLFSDIAELGIGSDEDLAHHYDVMTVNEALLALPKCQHFATFHDEKVLSWLLLRKYRRVNGVIQPDFMGTVTHSVRASQGVKCVHLFDQSGGTSTLFGVQVALHIGYERVIVCGAPLDASGRFFEPPWHAGHDYKQTDGWKPWEALHAAGEFEGKVFAMSGAPRDLLGSPPLSWYAQPVIDGILKQGV
jgi:hypothetical protein